MERRKFTREFKLEAVRLIKERGVSYVQAAEDLGVHQSQLRSWVKAFAGDPEHAFPGQGQMKPEQLEIARLKREVAKLKAERDILKNVWPAPSASDFVEDAFVQSASTYPASGSCPRPRWRSARPGPHKTLGVERHFLNQGSSTPFDCQAISLPPLANIVSPSTHQSRCQADSYAKIPDGVRLIYLPPYSPALQPA